MLSIVDFEYRRRDAFKTPAVIIRSILKGVVRDPPDVPPNRSRPVLRRLDPHEEIDGFRRRRGGIRHANRARASKTDPPLTRRALGGYGWSRKLLPGLVELMGIEPMTS